MNLINKLGLESLDYYKYYKSEMAEKGLDLGFQKHHLVLKKREVHLQMLIQKVWKLFLQKVMI